jgi:2-isopropylmalate synthase
MSTDAGHGADNHGAGNHGADNLGADRAGGHRRTGQHTHGRLGRAEVPESVDIFDTTLRDGSQQEGLSLTVDDKLRVAEQLDHLGVAYIEGGWPGANPKDEEFFARAPLELRLSTSTLVAFGSTRRPGVAADTDEVLANLVKAGTEVVCIVAKASETHVRDALRTSLDEALAMAGESVGFLRENGLRVFFDAEHFFDGFKENPEFSRSILSAALDNGAETLVLCDTNGGTLPHEVEETVSSMVGEFGNQIGVHFHNDSGCAVANSLAAVRVGATQVQGCVNGYGERAGNADLSAAIPNLSLKLRVRTIPPERLERLTPVAHHIAELVNVSPNPQQPYVGKAAFTHKAGLHTSAIVRRRDAYEHVAPDTVGNGTRFVVSELAGRSTLALKAEELGLGLHTDALDDVLSTLKSLEHRGYHFEVADGSLELLLRGATGWEPSYFEVESYRVISDHNDQAMTEATVKVLVAGQRVVATAEGNGPVNALDAALRQAIGTSYPELSQVHLIDYRVRVLDTNLGTGAVTRVLIDTTDGDVTWTTIGVSENIIEASWQALYESIVYGLLHSGVEPIRAGPEGGVEESVE